MSALTNLCEIPPDQLEVDRSEEMERYARTLAMRRSVNLEPGQRVSFQRVDGDAYDWMPCDRGGKQIGSMPHDLLYCTSNEKFYVVDNGDKWIPQSAELIKTHLQGCGFSASTEVNGERVVSQVQRIKSIIAKCQNVDFVGNLAGYGRGVYVLENGQRILITDEPRRIIPAKGGWPTIERLLTAQFNDEELMFLYCRIKLDYEALSSGTFAPGQAIFLVGPRNTGKTYLQLYLITPLLGGRVANPYQYMAGDTTFNSDIGEAEHLLLSDEKPVRDGHTRISFTSKVKTMVADVMQRIHPKHKSAFSAPVFWRITMSVNDRPDDLMALPQLSESMMDKVAILKVRPNNCFANGYGDREAFRNRFLSEIPAFLHHCLSLEIPEHLRDEKQSVWR